MQKVFGIHIRYFIMHWSSLEWSVTHFTRSLFVWNNSPFPVLSLEYFSGKKIEVCTPKKRGRVWGNRAIDQRKIGMHLHWPRVWGKGREREEKRGKTHSTWNVRNIGKYKSSAYFLMQSLLDIIFDIELAAAHAHTHRIQIERAGERARERYNYNSNSKWLFTHSQHAHTKIRLTERKRPKQIFYLYTYQPRWNNSRRVRKSYTVGRKTQSQLADCRVFCSLSK